MKRAPRLTIKYLKEFIGSNEFNSLSESSQLGYKLLLEKKEKNHEKRLAMRQEAKKTEDALTSEVMKNIKIGDVFSSSWGYDQTNVNFFQVIGLVGKNSVRVREVVPEIICDRSCGPMSSDTTYSIPTNGELLPTSKFSVFIKNNDIGDVKRITSYDGTTACFKLSSFAHAYKENSGNGKNAVTHYRSWYA